MLPVIFSNLAILLPCLGLSILHFNVTSITTVILSPGKYKASPNTRQHCSKKHPTYLCWWWGNLTLQQPPSDGLVRANPCAQREFSHELAARPRSRPFLTRHACAPYVLRIASPRTLLPASLAGALAAAATVEVEFFDLRRKAHWPVRPLS